MSSENNLIERINNTGTIFGHPKGLFLLFLTEMWERFSYYGMRGILMLYMTKMWVENGLNIPKDDASLIYGYFAGFVYFTPLIGGWLADKYLGQRKAITIGGIIMLLGQLVLFGMNTHTGLAIGLILLIIGNGLFKPNISTIVGQLYEANDSRRDSAFSIFYMGINLGALIAPLLIGLLAEDWFAIKGFDEAGKPIILSYGFKYGFLAAAIGMGLGQLMFNLLAKKYLLEIGEQPQKNESDSKTTNWYIKVIKQYFDFSGRARRKEYFTFNLINSLINISLYFMIILSLRFSYTNLSVFLTILAILYSLFILIPSISVTVRRLHDIGKSGWYMLISLIPIVGNIWMLILLFRNSNTGINNYGECPKIIIQKTENMKIERQRITVIFILTFFVIFFWAGFEQAGSSMTLYTDEYINRFIGNWEIPTTFFQSVNPILIVVLAPLFVWFWGSKIGKNLSTPIKMSLGMILLGIGFIFMLFATYDVKINPDGTVAQKAALIWLIMTYFFHTIGELCLSPVGLSMITKLAPIRLASLLMGVWMLSSFVANIIGGYIAAYVERLGAATIFSSIAIFVIALGVIMIILSKRLSKMMHGIN